jgi:hypothetical protein
LVLLFNLLTLTALTLVSSDKPPKDWYKSTASLFEFCADKNFDHPICPNIHGNFSKPEGSVDVEPEKIPQGALTAENLFYANTLYKMNKAPLGWLISLKITGPRPLKMDRQLWAEAQYLYARILFDQRKFQESALLFDRIVEESKGRALYHQERAWALFFSGQYDKALGSIVSSESPLIYPVPNFDKYFLIALVERETCRWGLAFRTIAKGRETLASLNIDIEKQPFVRLCDQKTPGPLCANIRAYYKKYFNAQIKRSMDDLDLLEIEMRDRRPEKQAEDSSADLVWPFVGENWKDELGYYSVPVGSQCA